MLVFNTSEYFAVPSIFMNRRKLWMIQEINILKFLLSSPLFKNVSCWWYLIRYFKNSLQLNYSIAVRSDIYSNLKKKWLSSLWLNLCLAFLVSIPQLKISHCPSNQMHFPLENSISFIISSIRFNIACLWKSCCYIP